MARKTSTAVILSSFRGIIKKEIAVIIGLRRLLVEATRNVLRALFGAD